MIKILTILSIILAIATSSAVSEEQADIDLLMARQKELDARLSEVEYISLKLQKMLFTGSYNDKYRAILSAMEVCNVSNEFLNELNNTFAQYEEFKKQKDSLVRIEKYCYKLQFTLLENELEYYKMLKVRRAQNDILDSIEIQIDTLMKSTVIKFIKLADVEMLKVKGQSEEGGELSEIYKTLISLKEMDRSNAIERINKFYAFAMDKKDADQSTLSLVLTADSIAIEQCEVILNKLDIKDFLRFVVEYIQIKEKYSYSPNIPLLKSFEMIETKLAYFAELSFRNHIHNTITLENCTEVIEPSSIDDGKDLKIKFYIRNQPISTEEINLFYISQKEFQTFNFDEDIDAELRNKILNYFSIWSGFDIITQDDKKYILELLSNSKAPSTYVSNFKTKFQIKSDEDIPNFLAKNELYKVSYSQLPQSGMK